MSAMPKSETPLTDAVAKLHPVKATWYNNATWGRDQALLAHARKLEQRNARLAEALDSFCLSVDLRTGLQPDETLYEEIRKEHGGAIAARWFETRAALKENKP